MDRAIKLVSDPSFYVIVGVRGIPSNVAIAFPCVAMLEMSGSPLPTETSTQKILVFQLIVRMGRLRSPVLYLHPRRVVVDSVHAIAAQGSLLGEEAAELWRSKVQAFRNLYGFLSQIIPYQDSDLERLYVFLRHLAAKLPRRKSGPAYQFEDEVKLEYYRLQKISEGSISLGA